MLPLEGGGVAFPITSTAGEQLLPQGTLLALSGISGAASRGSLQALTLLFCRLSRRPERAGKQQRNDSLAASSGKGIYSFFMENSLGSAPRHCPRMQLLSLRPQRGWESLTWPGCDAFHGLGVEITAGIVGLLG